LAGVHILVFRGRPEISNAVIFILYVCETLTYPSVR